MEKSWFLRVLWLFVFVLPHAFPSVSRANDSFTNLLGITLPKSPVCVSEYDQNMRLGSRGPDVIELQKILNISPDTRLTDVGPGSPGGETDYFGPLTHNAVVRFQEKYAAEILVPAETVQGTGFVGAYTRRKVKEVCSVLSSGMTSEDLTAAAILGFNKVFYRHLKSYKKTSSTTPWFPTSGGVGSSAPAPSASSPDSGQTTAPSTGTSGGSSGSSSSSAGGSPAGNQTPTPAPSPEPEPTSTSTPPAPTPAPAPAPTPTTTPISSEYPWHRNITAAVFWVGEPQGGGSSEDNALSAWDDEWQKHYGGYDDPQNRNGYYPAGFIPKENPFYLDVPYNDFNSNGTPKSNRTTVVPWANEKTTWGNRESMMKNRWVKITRSGVTCYGQIEDAGPYQYDDYNYVFSAADARPKNKLANSAGLDVSPALRDCLKFIGWNNVDNKVDWQFVNFTEVPDGPWRQIVTTSQVNWP